MSFVLAILALCTAGSVAAQATSSLCFSYSSYSKNNSTADDIKLLYDSFFQITGGGKVIQLTSDREKSSTGYAVYEKTVPVWNRSSGAVADFATHFQFVVDGGADAREGLTFFMASLGSPVVVSLLSIPSNQVIAVQFRQNPGGKVGVALNSVEANTNLNGTLSDGKPWAAWVVYDGGGKKLSVFLSRGRKPAKPVARFRIDLSEVLAENAAIGISASTGAANRTLLSWNFWYSASWNALTFEIKEVAKDHSGYLVLLIVVGFVLVACGSIFSFCWWRRYFKPSGQSMVEKEIERALNKQLSQGPRRFTYSELRAATKNFRDEEKLGQGGFGSVYKGVLRGTKEVVAVKRVLQTSAHRRKEYVAEVSIISRLGHRNVVHLLGWCHERGELLLVYEYMVNGSLDGVIFGDNGGCLDWGKRYGIACGVASALVYLHEDWDQCVVHRDVKSSNVMLDSDFGAKLGDFGLARLVEPDMAASHTTVVAGTLGYLAPECVLTKRATLESDVYSFGAVALEIACGRPALDDRLKDRCNMSLVEWVWDLYGLDKVLESLDERLRGDFKKEEAERLLVIGLWCSHPDPKKRPSMRQVLNVLRFEAPLPYIPPNMPVAVLVYSESTKPRHVLS